MVFNGVAVMTVAEASATAWQHMTRVPSSERISSHQLLDMVCCFPLYQLRRLALSLWTFLRLPPPDSFYSYSYQPSSSTSDDDDDFDYYRDDYGYGYDDGGERGGGYSSSSASSSPVDFDDNYYSCHFD